MTMSPFAQCLVFTRSPAWRTTHRGVSTAGSAAAVHRLHDIALADCFSDATRISLSSEVANLRQDAEDGCKIGNL